MTWKNIKGYRGDYQVSKFGNIRSLKRKTPKSLKQFKNPKDYSLVKLHLNSEKKIHLGLFVDKQKAYLDCHGVAPWSEK